MGRIDLKDYFCTSFMQRLKERFGILLAITYIALKGTSIHGQELSAPVHYYGLWNGIHPLEMVLDSQLQGYLYFPGHKERIDLTGKETAEGWQIAEVLEEGEIGGFWTLNHSDAGRKASWHNYNKTLGGYVHFSPKPVMTPDLQVRLFQFDTPGGNWYFFIYPAPPDKWRGIAWTNTQVFPYEVTGEVIDKEFYFSVYDPESPLSYALQFTQTRQNPRFGYWRGKDGKTERIRMRHRKGISLEIQRNHDYYRDMLLLLPALKWDAWRDISKRHVDPMKRQYRKEGEFINEFKHTPRPFQRQAIRMYAWVTWTFIRENIMSGTLHLANSWGKPEVIPFLIDKDYDLPLNLQSIWEGHALPQEILALLSQHPGGSEAALKSMFVLLRPDGIYIGTNAEIHIPTAMLKGSLPKESPLYIYYGK
jgi:hypothetical protein